MILKGLADSGAAVPDAMARQARNLLKIWNINAAAGRRYEPQPYCGEITLFRAADDEANGVGWGPDPIEQWRRLAESPLAVYRIPGTHTSMLLDPHNVEALAERLQESLDHALSKR
jgi:thioesterase domain-containing protein